MAKKILTPAAYATNNIQNQPDQVKGQASALKLSFDQTGIDAKSYTNTSLITELQETTALITGAHAIGANTAGITGDNVGDQLLDLITQLQSVVLGQIPNGTITDDKLSQAAGQILDKVSNLIIEQNDIKLTLLYNSLSDFIKNISQNGFVDVYESNTYIDPTSTTTYNAGNKTVDFDATGLQEYKTVSLDFVPYDDSKVLLIPKTLKTVTPKANYTSETTIEVESDNELVIGDKFDFNGTVAEALTVSGSFTEIDNTVTPFDYGNIGDIDMGSVVVSAETYRFMNETGVGIKVYLTDGTEAPFSILGANIVGNVNSVCIVDNKIVVTARMLNDIYVWVIDQTTATGDQESSKQLAFTATSPTNACVVCDGTTIVIDSTAENSTSPCTRAGIINGTTITWNFSVVTTLASELPIPSIIKGLYYYRKLYYGSSNNRTRTVRITISDGTETIVSAETVLTTPFKSNSLGDSFVKKYGSDIGRQHFSYSDEDGGVMIRYTDNDWTSESSIYLSDAENSSIYQESTTDATAGSVIGRIRIAYQKSTGEIAEKTIPDGTTTPSSETVLVSTLTNSIPNYLKYQDTVVRDGKFFVMFTDGTDYKRYGKGTFGSGYTLGLDLAVTVLSTQSYPHISVFSPKLDGTNMNYIETNQNGYVWGLTQNGATSVFTCTGKSVELDGIGLAVY